MAHSNFLTFDFDPVRVMEKISLIKTTERKMEYIADLLSVYKQVDEKWRIVLREHPEGLVWEKTEEYADILGIYPEYDLVIETSYNLIHEWPSWVVPKLETLFDVLQIRSNHDSSVVLERKISWDRLSELVYFDLNLYMEELDEIKDSTERLHAYEALRDYCLAGIKKGTLILIHPKSGKEVYPEKRKYKAIADILLKDYIDPVINKLKLSPYLKSRRKGEEPEVSPTYPGKLKWRGDDESLARLLELLHQNELIKIEYAYLGGLAAGHFMDSYEQDFHVSRVQKYFPRSNLIEDITIEGKIQWNSEQSTLIFLIHSLIRQKLLSHRIEHYSRLITTHFINGEKEYKGGSLQSVKSKMKKEPTQTEGEKAKYEEKPLATPDNEAGRTVNHIILSVLKEQSKRMRNRL